VDTRAIKMIEEILDRVVRLETRMCKLMEEVGVSVERPLHKPAERKYRNGVDISEEMR